MRLEKIYIPEEVASPSGLKKIDITKKPLGAVVALIGKNGAGKTRLLSQIQNYISTISPAEKIVLDHITNIPDSLGQPNFRATLDIIKGTYRQYLQANNKSQKEDLLRNVQGSVTGLFPNFQQRVSDYIKVVNGEDLSSIKAGISNKMTFDQILAGGHRAIVNNPSPQQRISNEFAAFNTQETVRYFNNLSNEICVDEYNLYVQNKGKQDAIVSGMEKKNSYILFNKFKNYVIQFLGKEFSYAANQGPNISSTLLFDGRPFNIDQLSPGEKTLFAYAVLFFYLDVSTKANIKDSIIIIDEPERHMHPGAQVKLIDALRSIVSDSGQLWIATHSVHILSHLEYDEILMVKDGNVILPSRTTPGNTFNELMEIDSHISKLMDFVNSISAWAFGNFMAQCLRNPDTVIGTNDQDGQYVLFRNFLIGKEPIKLLDFGAGKGRIGHTISEDDELRSRITCFAFEPDHKNLSFLRDAKKYSVTYEKLTEINTAEHNCVLLCSVLHEINPKLWVENFGHIKRALSDDGYLIIIEDKKLPKGELAHDYGYLIFEEDELAFLFNLKPDKKLNFNLDSEWEGRLLFFAIKKEDINVTEASIIEALKRLRLKSFEKIKKMKLQPQNDINNGREYANQTQLFINATHALEEFNELNDH